MTVDDILQALNDVRDCRAEYDRLESCVGWAIINREPPTAVEEVADKARAARERWRIAEGVFGIIAGRSEARARETS